MATLDQFKTAVRRKSGSPDIGELLNSDLEDIITEDVLAWINKRRPNKKLGQLTTVESQQDYTPSVGDDVLYEVTDVFWMSDGYDLFSPSLKFFPSTMDMDDRIAGYSVVDNPALVHIVYKAMEQYKNNFKGTGYFTEGRKIRLEPYPTEDGNTVYYFYTCQHWSSIVDVDDVFVDACKDIGAALVLEYLAIKRGIVRSAREFSGGGGEREIEAAKKFREKAEGLVPVAAAVFLK
jgi:hypothetical protein